MNKKNKLIKGKWWDINNKVKKIITAKYDKIKDWVIDPKGYFNDMHKAMDYFKRFPSILFEGDK